MSYHHATLPTMYDLARDYLNQKGIKPADATEVELHIAADHAAGQPARFLSCRLHIAGSLQGIVVQARSRFADLNCYQQF